MILQHSVVLRRTVRKNVEFALSSCGRRERAARVDEALSWVGLEGEGDRFAPHLSGGQQRKLSMAQVWAMRPRLLLLDEASTHLDSGSVRDFELLVKRVSGEGKMKVVMTSHDRGHLERLADEVAWLEDGKVIFYERVEDFLSEVGKDDLSYGF
jgi:tungstate transport system ATP-binding protein